MPARRGATPDFTFEGTDWVEDATGHYSLFGWSEKSNLSLCWLAEYGVKKAVSPICAEPRHRWKRWTRMFAARRQDICSSPRVRIVRVAECRCRKTKTAAERRRTEGNRASTAVTVMSAGNLPIPI